MAKKMILVDGSKCTGCKACSAACKEWNDLPTEKTSLVKSYQSMADFTPNTYTYVTFEEKYENNKMHWLMRKAQCFHCDDPSCLKACSSSAISKTDSGFVVIDQDKCIGCGYCAQYCPFHVPKVDESTKKANKCTGCVARVENDLSPSCVAICQPGALSFGNYDTMLGIAQARLAEVKKKFPNANLYGQNGQSGTTYRYILLDAPAAYGLPENPSTDLSLYLWKDIIRPIGKIVMGGAAAAVVAGVVINAVKGNYQKEPFEDHHQMKKEEKM